MCMPFQTYRRDVDPFETDTKGKLFIVDVSINWPSNRSWLTKVLDSWKVTQLTLPRQRSVNWGLRSALSSPPRSMQAIITRPWRRSRSFLVACLVNVPANSVHDPCTGLIFFPIVVDIFVIVHNFCRPARSKNCIVTALVWSRTSLQCFCNCAQLLSPC